MSPPPHPGSPRSLPGGSPDYALDRRLVRAAFERAAPAYERHARVQAEVGERLLERLAPVRLAPRRILDAGAGTGLLARRLARSYRGARVLAVDLAEGMLREARRKAPRWRSRQGFVCADAERLPLPGACVELVLSNLMLQWFHEPAPVLAELARVLAPGGLLQFSTFGPDTLRELRESWAAADGHVHVHAFLDMHDIGDALVRAGFADVVMDAERLTFSYRQLGDLMQELRGLGARNVSAGRSPGLTGRRRLERVREAYESRRREGRLPATFEVVYAHAWQPLRRPAEVRVDELARGERR